MSGKISGTIDTIEDTQTFGAKGFRKRVVIIEQQHDQWSNFVPLELTRDNCDLANDWHIGQKITAEYRLNGRKWQKDEASPMRCFLSAEVVKVEVESTGKIANAVSDSGPVYEDDDAPF